MQYAPGSWQVLISQNYKVNWVDIEKKIYNPIPDLDFSLSSSSILVGINCPKAFKEWRLAAYCSIQAKTITNSSFGEWVDVETKQLIIQRLTLIETSISGTAELRLKLKIPHWHEEIYLEIWQYTGLTPQSLQEVLADFQDKTLSTLSIIENQIAEINSQFTDE